MRRSGFVVCQNRSRGHPEVAWLGRGLAKPQTSSRHLHRASPKHTQMFRSGSLKVPSALSLVRPRRRHGAGLPGQLESTLGTAGPGGKHPPLARATHLGTRRPGLALRGRNASTQRSSSWAPASRGKRPMRVSPGAELCTRNALPHVPKRPASPYCNPNDSTVSSPVSIT